MITSNRAHVKEPKLGLSWPRLLVLGLGLYLVWVLAKGVFELRTAYGRIEEARQVLEVEKAKGEKLREKWALVQTREYLEEVARNDLNMQREGETVVVMSGTKSQNLEVGSQNIEEEKEKTNWEKWWSLVR